MKGMQTETNFCLRVDVDTFEGIRKGIPKTVYFVNQHECPTSFYLSMGKYATGRNIFRILKEKEKVLGRKISILNRNHWKDILRGIVLPPKYIGMKEAIQLREHEKNEMVEFYAHGYNHIKWSRHFASFNQEQTEYFLEITKQEFHRVFGQFPRGNASPNFIVNPYYFQILNDKGFEFAADFCYPHPFYLKYENIEKKEQEKSVIQFPVTEPTIEQLLQRGYSTEKIENFYKKRFREYIDQGKKYVCLYLHAIFEPVKMKKVLSKIIERATKYDMRLITHSSLFKSKKDWPTIDQSSLIGGGTKNE